MKNTIRLVIALGFAGFAVFLNFIFMPRYNEYTIYKSELPQGTVIERAHLESISLPERRDFQHSNVFIPWKQNSRLFGIPAPRDIKKGELALQNDIRYDDKHTILEPFRLAEPFSPGDDKIILAVSYSKRNSNAEEESFGRVVEQLLNIIDRDRNSSGNRVSIQSIIPRTGPQGNSRRGDEVSLSIDLSNYKITRPSSILEKDSLIGFVIQESLIPLASE